MNREFRLLSEKLTVRVVLAESVLVLLVFCLGPLLFEAVKTILDVTYRYTESSFWFHVYWFCSNWQYAIMVALFLVLNVFAMKWAFRIVVPLFVSLKAEIVKIPEEGREQTAFPPELREMEESIARAKAQYRMRSLEAREAAARKDDLVVSLAHDIRTPLTSVLGYLELLDESPDLPVTQRKKYAGVALRKARRLERLVEDLFEITRFNISSISLEKTNVNLHILLNQLREELMPRLRARGLSCEIENDGLTTVFADPVQLSRVLDNLLHNAASYAEENGRIVIRLAPLEGGRARIEVTNTGAEIPPEKLAHVFEKFYRADESRQSATGGSGLGLAIAKKIVEAHGGTISAKSGGGSTTFTLTL